LQNGRAELPANGNTKERFMRRRSLYLLAICSLLAVTQSAVADFIYFGSAAAAGRGSIKRSNLDGSDVITLVGGLTQPDQIALDLVNGHIYWVDGVTQLLQRSNLDGSSLVNIIATGLHTPSGLALDLVNGHLFWSDAGTGRIERSNLDGSGRLTILASSLALPLVDLQHLAVDSDAGKLYWATRTGRRIGRVDLDGSDSEALINAGGGGFEFEGPTGIALDLISDQLYATDTNTSNPRILRANLDGSGITNIGTGITGHGLTLDPFAEQIYFTRFNRISRVDYDGSGITDLLTLSPFDATTGIALQLSTTSVVPEPTSLTLAGLGAVSLILVRRMRRRA
jgi:sugar lactone lactonase YvrE